MPPRDSVSETNGHQIVVEHPSSVRSDGTTIETSKANGSSVKRSQEMTSTKSLSIVRNTFHWELNLYTAALLAFVYYFVIPQKYRHYMQVLFGLVAIDAGRYYYNKGDIPGCPYTFPFVSVIAMIIAPVRFWAEMANIAIESGQGMCTNILGSFFMVFCTDPSLCRQILTGEGTYQVYAHPNAIWLFDEKNLIYMPTEEHKKFRAILTPALFGKEALMAYAATQERVCRDYLAKFAKEVKETGTPLEARVAFRRMAAASSQEAFLGPYLTDELREQLENDIMYFTAGFLCFPFPYFNTGLAKAIKAKNRIENVIEKIVPKAVQYVKSGNTEARCMLERWILSIIEAAEAEGIDDPTKLPYCDERNLGRTVLDFLFAAQDATNSALAYSLDVLDAHRDVLLKMRKEVLQECGPGNHNISSKIHDSESLTYIGKVANQLLHHKPPVPMIPHLSLKQSVLGGHHIPTRAVVIPSIMYSARTSGASLEFLPDRQDQDSQFVSTVIFGGGQHKCPGRRYAESLLTVFLVILAQEYNFSRTGPRPGPDDFMYYPTVFPTDCWFNFEHNPEKVILDVSSS